jgi:DNA-directed RNA polymerase subunit omega
MIRKHEIAAMSKKLGGRFKLTVLIQKRIQELARGAAPLVALDKGNSLIDIAVEEILQGKVSFDLPAEEETKGKKKKE